MSKPHQIIDLFDRIKRCIDQGRYTQTKHALQRHKEREVDFSDALYVLRTGHHEKRKTSFDVINNT